MMSKANREYKSSVFKALFHEDASAIDPYKGKEAYPDEATLRLSDAFKYVNLPDAGNLPALELIVRVLNVNV